MEMSPKLDLEAETNRGFSPRPLNCLSQVDILNQWNTGLTVVGVVFMISHERGSFLCKFPSRGL